MTHETPQLQAFFELPNDLLMDDRLVEYELDCGLFADRIESLSAEGIVLGARERVGYAETLDAYHARCDALTDGYEPRRAGRDGDADMWYVTDGTQLYVEDGEEAVVDRDLYLYERHEFGGPVESIDDLARELSRLTGADLDATALA